MGAYENLCCNFEVILERDPEKKIRIALSKANSKDFLSPETGPLDVAKITEALKKDLIDLLCARSGSQEIIEVTGPIYSSLTYRDSLRRHSQDNSAYGVFHIEENSGGGADITFRGTSYYSNSMDARVSFGNREALIGLIKALQTITEKIKP